MVELGNGERKEVSKFDMVFGGLMHFRRDRCAMCVDWSAELSDISLADYSGTPVNPGDEASYSSFWCARTEVRNGIGQRKRRAISRSENRRRIT